MFNLQISSLVSKIYQTMSICTVTLESVCKIYPNLWHLNGNSYSTRLIHLSQLFRFKLFKLYYNVLKCVNLIEIRFYSYFYTILPCTLTYNVWHHCTDTGSWIRGPIYIFEGKYRYWHWGQITNTDFRLLLDMQKRTDWIKIMINTLYMLFNFRLWNDVNKMEM